MFKQSIIRISSTLRLIIIIQLQFTFSAFTLADDYLCHEPMIFLVSGNHLYLCIFECPVLHVSGDLYADINLVVRDKDSPDIEFGNPVGAHKNIVNAVHLA